MKCISDILFSLNEIGKLEMSYRRCSAKELGLSEAWMQNAIFQNPELIIEPCRAAGLTDEDWFPWLREFPVKTGKIDILLLSSEGRVGLVETKLTTNPEIRRKVLAQVLDYVSYLPEEILKKRPDIPVDESGAPIVEIEDVLESLYQGDILIMIVSDEIKLKTVKLSQSLLARNITRQWDLALIDVAFYCKEGRNGEEALIVPHVRNVVRSEPRHVIRIVVEGEKPKTRVEVIRVTSEIGDTYTREKWNEDRFFRYIEKASIPGKIKDLVHRIKNLAHRYEEFVSFGWGTGKSGSMILKVNGRGIIEIYGSGVIKFRPDQIKYALGEEISRKYLKNLEKLAPEAMKMMYPRISPERAAQLADELYQIIERVLDEVEKRG